MDTFHYLCHDYVMSLKMMSNLIILFLSLGAIWIIVASIFNISIIFPSEVVEDKQIPQERLVSIRLAVFATFAYYGISHLLNRNRMFYPIHFLRTFLYFLSFMGAITYLHVKLSGDFVSIANWLHTFFWFVIAAILHLGSTPQYKRIFKKK